MFLHLRSVVEWLVAMGAGGAFGISDVVGCVAAGRWLVGKAPRDDVRCKIDALQSPYRLQVF